MVESDASQPVRRQDDNSQVKFPFTITPVDAETTVQLLNDFTGGRDGYVQVGPKKYFFPRAFAEYADQFYNFEAREDDIWIVTHPRSGTTMTQELIWLIANDLDYERAQSERLMRRFPFFESYLFVHKKEESLNAHRDDPKTQIAIEELCSPVYEILTNTESPRFIKTHLPFSLMPPSVMKSRAKVIYVARNPKDVAVSWYYLNRMWKVCGFRGDFSQFWHYFEKDLTYLSPYWEHIKEGWAHRDEPNVIFLFYEDLNKDLSASILKIAAFLNKAISDDDLKGLIKHLQFNNFRKNQAVNAEELIDWGIFNSNEASFVRKGKVSADEWQEEYTPELIARAQTWIDKSLKGTTLKFPECGGSM